MQVSDNAPLAPWTTLRLGGPARRIIKAERDEEILECLRASDSAGEPVLVLGGGSNLVVSDQGFAGTVLRMATSGRVLGRDPSDPARVLVTAAAGEVWDDLVASAVDEGLAGMECLGGIPGLVGAVPMQNVGAYGQDVSETIVKVRAYDRERGAVVEIDRASCAFGYRTSAFRGKHRHVILSVTFSLAKSSDSRPIRYAELSKALGVREGESAPLKKTRETVIELRRKKGMVLDPSDPDTTSAGSFFTNPILSPTEARALEERARDEGKVPMFEEPDGRVKVSAGWLIERAGFTKGYQRGRAAVSSKHALALTNRGGATTEELLALAREVQAGVRARFGVTLENEPVFIGVKL